MNNDELQKAIDDITNSNLNQEASLASDATAVSAENEQLANELASPVETGSVDIAPAPAPAIPETPGMPPVGATEEVAPEMEAAITPTTAPVAEPVVAIEEEVAPAVAEPEVATPVAKAVETPEVASSSDEDTLEEAMKELYPLLDKVEMPAEEKFDITMKYGTPSKALDFAKKIEDETEKAKALVKIIDKLK